MPTTIRVGVLAYPSCLGTEVFAVIDLLAIAQRTHAALSPRRSTAFDVRVVARTAGPVAVSSRCTINAVKWTRRFDLVVVPGFDLDPAADLDDVLRSWEPECRYIKRVAATGTDIASVCVGAFLLGEAGLLDHRQATTSWLFADSLATRYPTCRVQPDQIRVEDGPVTTVAAFSAVNDLAIAIVRKHLGDRTARLTAKIALVGDSRTSQAPYTDAILLPRQDEEFARAVCDYLGRHLGNDYDLATLAVAMHVSGRTLLRRFRDQTGTTPLRYLQRRRVNRAKELLERGVTCDDAMRTAGYTDPAAFRRLFKRETGMPPGAYRRQFARPTNGRDPFRQLG